MSSLSSGIVEPDERSERPDMESKRTGLLPVCVSCEEANGICKHCYRKRFEEFCVYCKKQLEKSVRCDNADVHETETKECTSSEEDAAEERSLSVCLFCRGEDKRWCILNRICVSCKENWHKKRFDDFMANKIRSCDVCANNLYKGLKSVKHDCTRVGIFVCDYCSTSYGDKLDLEKHMGRRYGRYTCRNCSASYCKRKEYNSHCKSHKTETDSVENNNGEKLQSFLWDLCEIEFHTEQSSVKQDDVVIAVVSNEDKESSHSCLYCSQVFTSDKLLKEHYPIHKANDRFKCIYCDKSFTTVSKLRIHLDCHENLRKYKCAHCDKRFNQRLGLVIHESTHENRGKHRCERCGRGFTYKNSLRRHENSHENLRKYKCKYCDKTFNHFSCLKSHEDVHENLRKYRCKYCDNGFNHFNSLKKHELSHEKQKREYECKFCHKIFNVKRILKKHETACVKKTKRL